MAGSGRTCRRRPQASSRSPQSIRCCESGLSETVDDWHNDVAGIDTAGRCVDAADFAGVGAIRGAALGLELSRRAHDALRIRLAVARPPVSPGPVSDSPRRRSLADFIAIELVATDARLVRRPTYATKRRSDVRGRRAMGMIDAPIVGAIPLSVALGAAEARKRNVFRQSACRPFDRQAVRSLRLACRGRNRNARTIGRWTRKPDYPRC